MQLFLAYIIYCTCSVVFVFFLNHYDFTFYLFKNAAPSLTACLKYKPQLDQEGNNSNRKYRFLMEFHIFQPIFLFLQFFSPKVIFLHFSNTIQCFQPPKLYIVQQVPCWVTNWITGQMLNALRSRVITPRAVFLPYIQYINMRLCKTRLVDICLLQSVLGAPENGYRVM